MKYFYYIIVFFSFSYIGLSQNLPAERRVNWNEGINQHQFIYPTNEINFVSAGGIGDGITANDTAISNLLNSIGATGAIIYFPAGEYFFESTINLKSNVVLRGESSSNTTLKFNLQGANNLIQASGNQTSIESNFVLSTSKDNYTIQVENASLFSVNDYLRISDNDSDKITSSWATGSTGQIVKIQNITGNTLILTSALRRDYIIANIPKVTKINPIKNVGVENLTINRTDATTTQTTHIEFNYAANCKVNCIKSYNSNFAHISFSYSTNCKVEGSYFQDAFAYGGNGQGYGVVLQYASGECLIYNNIFKHLRHSMLFQAGANGDVVSYNYSIDPYWTETISNAAGDLVLHGNYPYCNLLEGNIVQNIVIDNSHGINGPYNTFLRNRGELYGIFMNSGAGNSQNFISNEVTNTGLFLGLYTITGTDNFQYGNNVKGTIYAVGTTQPTDNSLYLSASLPYYATNSFWPPIGIISNYNTYSIESKSRYNASNLIQCDANLLSDEFVEVENDGFVLFPNPVSNTLSIKGIKKYDTLTVVDILGKVYKTAIATEDVSTSISVEDLKSGFYFIIVTEGTIYQKTLKFIKK